MCTKNRLSELWASFSPCVWILDHPPKQTSTQYLFSFPVNINLLLLVRPSRRDFEKIHPLYVNSVKVSPNNDLCNLRTRRISRRFELWPRDFSERKYFLGGKQDGDWIFYFGFWFRTFFLFYLIVWRLFSHFGATS